MRTLAEIKHAFTPVQKMTEGQKMRLMKITNSYIEMASDIEDLIPDCPDRTVALRKLLESKMISVQALTHYQEPVALKKAPVTPTKGPQNASTSNESGDDQENSPNPVNS